jgi:glycosyltransferase involved in cell wall biosynthesis
MKILQVIPYFYPATAFGGPVKVAYDICFQFVKRGHHVTVLTSDAKNLSERLQTSYSNIVDGIEVHYFKNISMKPVEWSKIFLTPDLIPFFKQRIKEYDVVHFHEYQSFQNIIGHYYAKKYHIPYVIQPHGSLSRIGKTPLKILFDELFGKQILNNAKKIFTLTETEYQQCLSYNIEKTNISLIPNGINVNKYQNKPVKNSFKKKYGINENIRILLYVGRIHNSKGIDFLIKAYSYLINKYKMKDILLVICGPDDGYKKNAVLLSKKFNVDSLILFTGLISDEEIIMAFNDADLFITPKYNGFPITFLESCLMGVPIVTTTSGDSLPWINGQVGEVTFLSSHNIANSIMNILSNNELKTFYSNNCAKIIERYSIVKIVDQMEKVYSEIIR